MARTWTDNTLRFTAANDGFDSRFTCKTITVRPSAAAWVVVIKDLDGVKIKFEANGADDRGDTFDVFRTVFNGAVLTIRYNNGTSVSASSSSTATFINNQLRKRSHKFELGIYIMRQWRFLDKE